MSRLEQLQKLADAQPEDPLARYAVGLECMQLKRWAEAEAAFDRTLTIDPHYSAAYFQKARAQIKLGQPRAAAATLRKGIDVAAARGESHTVDKMKELLETLL